MHLDWAEKSKGRRSNRVGGISVVLHITLKRKQHFHCIRLRPANQKRMFDMNFMRLHMYVYGDLRGYMCVLTMTRLESATWCVVHW